MDNLISDKHIHDGHRKRMKAKLAAHGQRIFDTYELLEMLLYYVIPYKDTNPISKRLLAAFGSLDGVLSASREQLLSVSGIGESACSLISDVNELSYILGAEILPDNVAMNSYEKIGEHLLEHFKDKTGYNVAMMMFDNNMNHIATYDVAGKDYDNSSIQPGPFVECAIKQKAAVVITAHNHPYGPAFPSQGDRATNSLLKSGFEAVGITFLNHYLISGDRYYSIADNKIPTMSQTPAIKAFLEGRRISDDAATESADSAENVKYNTADFELFKALIGYANKRGNSEYIARRLLGRYYTIENVLCADILALEELSNANTATALKLFAYVTSRRVTDGFLWGRRHTLSELADYLKALYIGVPNETVYAILFDKQWRATSCEFVSEGTVSASELLPRKLIQIAVTAGAASVAISHNHPMGNPSPSREDVDMTSNIESVLAISRLGFVCHFVVAGQVAEIVKSSRTLM